MSAGGSSRAIRIGVVRTVKDAVAIVLQRPAAFMMLVLALVWAPQALQTLLGVALGDPVHPLVVLTAVAGLVMLGLFSAATTFLTFETVARRPAPVIGILVLCLRDLWPITGIWVAYLLFGAAIVATVLSVGVIAGSGPETFTVFVIAAILAFVAFSVVFSLLMAARVAEGAGIVETFRRSRQLTRGHGLEIFLVMLILGLVQIGWGLLLVNLFQPAATAGTISAPNTLILDAAALLPSPLLPVALAMAYLRVAAPPPAEEAPA